MKILFVTILTAFMLAANAQNPVQKETTVFYNSFSWSPDGSRLCFSVIVMKSGVFDRKFWEIGSIDIQNLKVLRVTDNRFDDDWPVYSPDGKRIAFQSDRDGSPQIYLMNADGTHLERLSNNGFIEMHPAWSPDGKQVMFISDRDGNQEIYKMNTDGSAQTRLTTSPYKEFNPQWSPDGKKIVYYYEKGDQHDQIYIADSDGKNSTRLTSDSTHNYYPVWSADGKSIIYGAGGSLWQMKVNQPDEKRELLPGTGYAKYSPDGSKIAFKKGAWPSNEIWICNSDGSNMIRLTDPQKIIGLFTAGTK